MVDHEQVSIDSEYAFKSTYDVERVVQYAITSKEISDIISSSKKIFADMMKITVSEKEDAKIWKAFDNVDEQKIFLVTIGLPVAFIGAVEALPFLYAYGQSASLPSIGKAFTVNSFRTGMFKGGSNLFGQLATNDFKFDDQIDYADPLISSLTGGWGSVLAESAFELRFGNKGVIYGYEGNQNLLNNTLTNSAGNILGSKLQAFGKPLNDLSPNIGQMMTELIGGTFIESGENVLGNEIKLKLKIKKGE